jgi:hypothetical protein
MASTRDATWVLSGAALWAAAEKDRSDSDTAAAMREIGKFKLASLLLSKRQA